MPVLAGVLLFALCIEANNRSGSNNLPIEVTTEKSVYKIGEKVVIKIRNNGKLELRDSITIRIKDADDQKVFETIYMGGWSPIAPGDSIEEIWHQEGIKEGGKYQVCAYMENSSSCVKIRIS